LKPALSNRFSALLNIFFVISGSALLKDK